MTSFKVTIHPEEFADFKLDKGLNYLSDAQAFASWLRSEGFGRVGPVQVEQLGTP